MDTAPASQESPIVLLHGMVGDVDNWNSTIQELSQRGKRVIVPVLPIYSIARTNADLDGLVGYLSDFFESLNIPPCLIGGNSMGGQLAVLFSVANPHHVERLLLSGASGITEVDLGSSIMRRKDRAYLRNRIEKTFFDPIHCSEDLVDDIMDIINTRENAVRLISFARSVQSESISALLSEIRIPTLIVWGNEDQITPVSVAYTLKKEIEDSTLEILDECGHAPMMEHPKRFNEVLLEFIAATDLVSSESTLA